jgi:hypothetical protein
MYQLSEAMLQKPLDLVFAFLDVVSLVEGDQLGDRQVISQEMEPKSGERDRNRQRQTEGDRNRE